MGTKNQPGKHDCYKNALPDEPMFTLLARDISAPDLVIQWARQREAKIQDNTAPVTDELAVNEALNCATDMKEWREKNQGAWRNSAAIKYNERLLKIIEDHCAGKMLNAEINALAEELQNEWLMPIKFMSCTALKPCGEPTCVICRPKGK